MLYLETCEVEDVDVWDNLLYAISQELAEKFGSDYNPLKVKQKVHKEWARFKKFRDYIQLPGVDYDPMNNKINVEPIYWQHIRRVSGIKLLLIHI